jgi:TIR domain/WD domain, G-beta repeat
MTDLFISYSRHDLDFVMRLHDELKKNNRNIWIDLEDIPPTAEWLEEIYGGIENANTFVFVISPDSVVSNVCKLEIEHAIKNGKRLVPILHRDVLERSQIHPSLASHNWLFFRENDNFERSFKWLTNALDTDLDHVRIHTRLLVRALEWEQRKRDSSYILRGTDLSEAEEWLTTGANKQPLVTQTHSQYILASRRAAAARQRATLIGVTAALVFSLTLSVLALFLWRQAEDARFEASNSRSTAVAALGSVNDTRATAQAQENSFRATINALNTPLQPATNSQAMATATGISAQPSQPGAPTSGSESQADISLTATALANLLSTPSGGGISAEVEDEGIFATETLPTALPEPGFAGTTELLLLLAAQNYKLAIDPVQAKSDLLIALQRNGVKLDQTLSGHNGAVLDVAYSPDGQKLASASDDNTVIVWDTATLRPVGDLPFYGHYAGVTSVDFSPDSQILASGSRDSTIILWNAATGQIIRALQRRETSWILSVDFSPDGQTLVSAGQGSTIRLWNAETGDVIREFQGSSDTNFSAAFSPNGQQIAVGSGDGSVTLWDVASGTEIRRWQAHYGATLSLLFTPDGLGIETAGGDGFTTMWDVETGNQLLTLKAGQKAALSVAMTADQRLMAVGSGDNVVRLWDMTSGIEIGLPLANFTDWVYGVDFNPAGTTLASVSGDGSVVLWDVNVESWLARACAAAGRNLTQEEWDNFFPDLAYEETCS